MEGRTYFSLFTALFNKLKSTQNPWLIFAFLWYSNHQSTPVHWLFDWLYLSTGYHEVMLFFHFWEHGFWHIPGSGHTLQLHRCRSNHAVSWRIPPHPPLPFESTDGSGPVHELYSLWAQSFSFIIIQMFYKLVQLLSPGVQTCTSLSSFFCFVAILCHWNLWCHLGHCSGQGKSKFTEGGNL